MIPDQYITTGVLLGVITLLFYVWNKNRKLPPGPWGLPFLGYYPFLDSIVHIHLANLAKRYGNVFSFRTVGGKLFVIINGTKMTKEILVNRADEFIGRPHEMNIVGWISDELGITQEDGAPWKEQRKFFLQSARHFGFGKLELEEEIIKEIQTVMEELREIGGKPINCIRKVQYATNCVVLRVLFNKRFEKNDPKFLEICEGMEDMVKIFLSTNVFLVGRFFKSVAMRIYPGASSAEKAKLLMKKVAEDIVNDHIRTHEANNPRDVIDDYLDYRNKLKGTNRELFEIFSLERLIALTINMFLEGTESVANCIQGFLKKISEHTEIQEKMKAEIDSVVGKERFPSWVDKKDLPYSDAVVQELYRTTLPFNTTTLYSNFEEAFINGYRIPKRSILMGNLWSMSYDPDFYSHPTKFDPERFLNSEGKRIKQEGPYAFGIGKRSCVGESLAQMEVFLFITSLVQKFTVFPGSEKEETLRFVSRK